MLMVMDLTEAEASKQIEELVKERAYARQKKDWAKADKMRDEVKKLGFEVIDTRDGPRWREIR